MKNKKMKAFTIAELLAVIVIIATLAVLIVSSVISYRQKAVDEYINSLKGELELAAKSYYSDNPKELPRGQIENNYKKYNTYIMASNLAHNNYFTNELVDDNGNSCEVESYVVIDNEFDTYDYNPCLVCNGKVLNEDDEYCKFGPEIIKNPYCSIKVENTEREYTKKLVIHTNGTIISSSINAAKDGNYYVIEPGLYEFTVKNDEGEASCSTHVYMKEDDTPPECSVSCTCTTGEDECSCIATWSDNGMLKSVKDSIDGGLEFSYPYSYDEYAREDCNNISPIKVKRGEVDNYTVTVTDANDNSTTCSAEIEELPPPCSCEITNNNACYDYTCDPVTCKISKKWNDSCIPDPEPETPTPEPDPEPEEPVHDGDESNPDTGAPGSGSSLGCFLKGTKVLTKYGYKNIEDIVEGDYVLSYNEKTKLAEYNKVYVTFIHPKNKDELYELTIKGKILKVTSAHRFYVKEFNGNDFIWKKASELNVGDIVIDSNNNEYKITNINHYKHFGTVYNFGVENNYNYYVSEDEILVHNAMGGLPSTGAQYFK